MLLRHSAMPYTLRDSPFFRLHTRKKLAALLHVSEAALADISARNDLYARRWKHKKEKDIWLREQPAPDISAHYRPIDIPDGGLKAVQSRIAKLICPPLSGPETMIVWTTKGTTDAIQKAQAGRDHREAA